MVTFNLIEASNFLNMHPETVRHYAKAGKLPGAKPGKSWVFIEEDLAQWIRNKYCSPLQVPQGEEKVVCNSHNAGKKASGGFVSPRRTASEYSALLKLPKKG